MKNSIKENIERLNEIMQGFDSSEFYTSSADSDSIKLQGDFSPELVLLIKQKFPLVESRISTNGFIELETENICFTLT